MPVFLSVTAYKVERGSGNDISCLKDQALFQILAIATTAYDRFNAGRSEPLSAGVKRGQTTFSERFLNVVCPHLSVPIYHEVHHQAQSLE